jgi:N-acetylmuramoyl-L-alanine amidase
MSNEKEMQFLRKASTQKIVAKSIAEGIAAWLESPNRN